MLKNVFEEHAGAGKEADSEADSDRCDLSPSNNRVYLSRWANM